MKYIETTDRQLLTEEANSMNKDQLVDFYWTYYGQDRDELEEYSVSELRQIFIEGQLI